MRLLDMQGTPSAVQLAASQAALVSTPGAQVITGDSGNNTLTSISGGIAGDWLILRFADAKVTITTAAAKLLGNASFVSAINKVLFLFFDGTNWLEVSRTAQAGIDANTPIVADVTGNVTGNLAGNVTGNSIGQHQSPQVARTATVDGLTTGIIADGTESVVVTSSVNTKLITLPTPTPGYRVKLSCAANGYKLQSSNKATIKINNVADGSKVLDVAAGDLLIAECNSATEWYVWKLSNLGAPATAGVPA